MIEITKSKIHNDGVATIKTIAATEIKVTPLIKIKSNIKKTDLKNAIICSFENLTIEQKVEFMKLDITEETKNLHFHQRLVSIFNQFKVEISEHYILFPIVPKINHSCKPNTINLLKSGTTCHLIIIPYETIEPGHEITINYAPKYLLNLLSQSTRFNILYKSTKCLWRKIL